MIALHEKGDSIVEVLIALAIISSVLVSAFAITTKNVQSLQDNQERIQAQNLVQGQIESLRAQNGITTSGGCFNGVIETSACNAFTQSGSGATYTVSVTGPAGLNHAPPSLYTVTVRWTGQSDKTNNASQASMVYRLN